MFRFFAFCTLLAMACVTGIVLLSDYFKAIPKDGTDEKPSLIGKREGARPGKNEEDPAESRSEGSTARPTAAREVKITEIVAAGGGTGQPLIIQDGKVLAVEKQEVPSERDGKLLLLATPVSDDEIVPKDKEAKMEVALLGIEWRDGDEKWINNDSYRKPAIKEPFIDQATGKKYRFPRVGDTFSPETTKTVRIKIRFRRLSENDEVREGQLLGVINPAVAVEELGIKQSKLVSAISDVDSSKAMKEESIRRLAAINKARGSVSGAISRDDQGAAEVTVTRYKAEEAAKRAGVVQAQQELSGAWTALDLYFIRAQIPGRIRTIYRQPGEAVKNLDPVLQIQNTRRLRIEAQVEVQDALPLQERLKRAESHRAEANRLAKSDPAASASHLTKADELTRVEVEVTRPTPPKAVLSADLSEITCVAVTRGALPRIISGSEQGMVRIWDRIAGEDRWQEKYRFDHGSPIRSLACTGPKATKNYLVTATFAGHLRLFDLDNIKTPAVVLGKDDEKARHQGAVHAVAFNAKGTLCASGGDDRSICIWDVEKGTLLAKKSGAHKSMITSLSFTPSGTLVSAGRDRRLAVWEIKDSELIEVDELPGRSNDVGVLGLDPTGEKVLFDEGRELRVISLGSTTRHRIEGSLLNAGATGTFSTMALFSPNGRTIMTNGNGPGRLQLWRAPTVTNRAAELRQLLWISGTATCGAFDPSGNFAVTGTSDHRILVWDLPKKEESEKPLPAQLTYVEDFLDTGLKKLNVRATLLEAKDWVIPGSSASLVVPAR